MTVERDVLQLLGHYADARLGSPPGFTTRSRARLVDAFVSARLADTNQSRRRFPRRWLLAAAVVIALVGSTSLAAAESGPGQPFYHVRLGIESLTLPSAGPARVEGLLGQLRARLNDAEQASRRGDATAVADAIQAYDQGLAELGASAAGTSALDQHVLAELGRHLAVLEDLLRTTPSQARPGLEHAIDNAQRARDAISQPSTGPRNGPPDSAHSRNAVPSGRP